MDSVSGLVHWSAVQVQGIMEPISQLYDVVLGLLRRPSLVKGQVMSQACLGIATGAYSHHNFSSPHLAATEKHLKTLPIREEIK